jgi:uncharacterized repeat protein (TIGR03803 family)
MVRPFRFLIVLAAAVGLTGFLSAQTEQTLYTFTGTDGNSPLASLVMDPAGNLFGTTFVGGAYGAGEVFELQRGASGWTQSVIYSFTGGADGADPYYADVIFDASGNLYGTTVEGGAHNLGAVFELTPTASGWSESVIYSFSGGKDGSNPYAGLLFDTAGNLHGTTYDGGEYNAGTVFELSPAGNGQWSEKVIHTFNVKDGNAPAGGLAHDGSGNLYGVTQGGGAHGYGVVYKLSSTASGWAENILHSFTGGADGGFPYAERLILDSSGSLYGTTQGGGAFQKGAVFRLSQGAGGGWQEQVLYSFEGNPAGNPYAGLVSDTAGNLYGTCANGNGVTSLGAVFELIKESGGKWKGATLHVFTGPDGQFPVAALVRDAAGNLYGTAWLGGGGSVGVVFEVGAKTVASSGH